MNRATLIGFLGKDAEVKTTRHPAFEVASVRPHKGIGNMERPQFLPGGRFTYRGPLPVVIALAYDVPLTPFGGPTPGRLSGAPLWDYDFEAKAETGAIPDGLSAKDREYRMRPMIAALLADRFKLALHREMKEVPVYALVVGKGGPKLQKADIEEKDCPVLTASGRLDGDVFCHAFISFGATGLRARAATVSDLASYISSSTDRPLLDKTGIKGLFHIQTPSWQPLNAAPTTPTAAGGNPTAAGGTNVADRPTLFEVLERLGLRMESQKGSVEFVVIDHIEKPTEN